MSLESIFGWAKRQVLGDREFATLDKLQAAVVRYFRRRARETREHRH